MLYILKSLTTFFSRSEYSQFRQRNRSTQSGLNAPRSTSQTPSDSPMPNSTSSVPRPMPIPLNMTMEEFLRQPGRETLTKLHPLRANGATW